MTAGKGKTGEDDRGRPRRAVLERRTPSERDRVLAERVAEVAAMRLAGTLPDGWSYVPGVSVP